MFVTRWRVWGVLALTAGLSGAASAANQPGEKKAIVLTFGLDGKGSVFEADAKEEPKPRNPAPQVKPEDKLKVELELLQNETRKRAEEVERKRAAEPSIRPVM